MKTRFLHLIFVATVAGTVSTACGDDDDSSGATGGASHQGGKASTGGLGNGGAGHAGAGHGGVLSTGGVGEGGSSGAPEGGGAGAPVSSGGTNPGAGGSNAGRGGVTGNGGTSSGGTGTGGISIGGAGGAGAGGGPEGGAGGEGRAADPLVQRGQYLVLTVAQCQSCHTDTQKGTGVLAGNPSFRVNGALIPTPNLTPDATGLRDWSDEQIKRAFRDGIDDEDRQLSAAMPYWLYHNLTDADADAIVAYLRSIAPIANEVPPTMVVSTAVTPLAPSAFPSTSLTSGPEFESAQHGKYLLTSAARCVGCHSVSTNGVPAPAFSGRPPNTAGLIYPANLTPDATGTAGWTANDLATVLLTHTAKGKDAALCGSMPRYTGLTQADALAIGYYLTTIPPVENTAASLPGLPDCPPPPSP